MKHYHVNHNMPGYLPEADGVATAEWSEALDALRDEIKAFQDIWQEECSAIHENPLGLTNCPAEGGCGWDELYWQGEADRLGFEFLEPGDEWGSIYDTPEGADVSIWLQACSVADCVMSCDEN